MGAQTRSSVSNSPIKAKPSARVILLAAEEDPHRIFVLPSNASKDARFLLLKNPRNGRRCRYYFCPSEGIFEVTKIDAGGRDPKSVLLAPRADPTISKAFGSSDKLVTITTESEVARIGNASDVRSELFEGYVNKSTEIFVATPFDPVFILLPLLDQTALLSRSQRGEGHFRPFDDILDDQLDDDRHLNHVFTDLTFRPTLLNAMNSVCDMVEAGDEQMYRLSVLKLNQYLLAKSRRVVGNGLPASMEDRFVTRFLGVPILNIKREVSSVSLGIEENDMYPEFRTPDMSESQSSVSSTNTSVPLFVASSTTSMGTIDYAPSASLIYLQRLRTAMSFITSSYLEPKLCERLVETSRACKASPDFGPLDEHLQHLAKLRTQALTSHSLSDFSKKRNLDDDEATEERAEKKRKQEEEDKKKKGQESRGVRDLKKVNVSGMKKMSDFFGKKAPTAKLKS